MNIATFVSGRLFRTAHKYARRMKKIFYAAALPVLMLALAACRSEMKKITVKDYPVARMDSTVDDYFGTRVEDPYRWMEDDNASETAAWVRAENEVTQHYLAQIPYRDKIRGRLTELWNYPKYDVPRKVGGYYFFFENDGLRNQSVLYRQQGLSGKPEPFLDPNTLSDQGTVALIDVSFSKDDRYLAYAAASAGSDWVEIRVMETATGRTLPDVIRWVKFSGAVWSGEGFYYSGYDEPDRAQLLSGQNRDQKVYYHRLGTPQDADELVYSDPQHPLRYLSTSVSRDGRMLFITATEGTSGTEILYKKLDPASAAPARMSAPARASVSKVTTPGYGFKVLFPGFAYDYSLVYGRDGKAVFYTNDGALNGRLLQADLSGVTPVVTTLVPEGDCLMEGAVTAGGNLMVFWLDKAQSRVSQYTLSGEKVRDVELPGIGTVTGMEGDSSAREAFYAYSSFTMPTEIYRYDLSSGASEPFKTPSVTFDPGEFVAEQVFYPSKDGTQVSMFLVHRKDLRRDGSNPVYLYGYGGFNINRTPGFAPQHILLMEQGGIYALANLRGGGEYGEAWHKAGMLANKQNVFDDFIAAGEYLIREGYTSPEKLAIAGGSNGGLLVGACMTQRPDLFAVALPAVGVMDMLRYQYFTCGWGWAVEYGSSDNAEQFPYLYAYSPLHNIRKGTCYPATLITTADHDDRVVPAHSFKFAATLQAAQGCDRPALIRIDTDAGHGAGKPTSKKIDELTDTYSFLFWNTGVRKIR